MRYLLSTATQPVLQQLALCRTLCAFDFDGTLAPIVDDPSQAALRDDTRRLLTTLAGLYPCVILSGRARADVAAKVCGIPLERIIGSHGAETELSPANGRPQVEEWKLIIERNINGTPGVWVEDKGHSLAIHYRQAPEKAAARRRILGATRELDQARIFGGKLVINISVSGDPHKGTALAAERARLACDSVLFAGDDENDEEAFAISGAVVGVRIGFKRTSGAGYYLRSQQEIDKLMTRLIELRSAATP
ncbi:MAG TPA: trehalose-phosphatase [Hyphomonadaceae bacterium]|nr:trehalose-phosphatase [Hyphomonadaceae bacterium]